MGSSYSRGAGSNNPAIDAEISRLTSTHPVVIFSKTYCPYCRKAKSAIEASGRKVAGFEGAKVIELDLRQDGSAMQAALARRTGRSTVPNVFIGGRPVGGGDDMAAASRSGVLSQMLRAAPDQLAQINASKKSRASASSAMPGKSTDAVEESIVLGAGCFWGVELAFQRLEGVIRTEVGYSNGKFTPVSYHAVCTGRTGHAEVVRVWYRPEEVGLKDILALWEERHDVTSLNKQGNDRGTQYRSAIFYTSEEQRDVVLQWKKEAETRLGKTVVTEIAKVQGYSPAEDYHQRYLEKKGQTAEKGSKARIRCYG